MTLMTKQTNDALQALAVRDHGSGIRTRFKEDTTRAERFSFDIESLFFDFSKSHISSELIQHYVDYAKQLDFAEKRSALFAGQKINRSEDRSVLHTLLRNPSNHGIPLETPEIANQAQNAFNEFRERTQQLSERLQQREVPLKNIIHIGIGGSSLGSQLIFEALKDVDLKVDIHFLGNIDGHELADILAKCTPDSTMFIGVSKSFGTAETLQNIRTIGAWYEASMGEGFLNQVVAVTANPQKALEFGVPEHNVVSFPVWVGGRYSLWSSVSLSVALLLGQECFDQLLEGAAAMDAHFLNTPPAENLSFIAASLDHYYVNFLKAGSRAIFAYDYRLRSLVDYLQQLETESNGKDRQLDGQAVEGHTSPVLWGGVGTNVQHSVFQMLHQGTNMIPSEFILVKQAEHDYAEHHRELLANGVAQTAALLAGQTIDEVTARAQGEISDEVASAKVFSGDRPSTTILLRKLDARTLGALLAFYEHRTYCFGLLCNINSFDQMGVELGKRLAREVEPFLNTDSPVDEKISADQFDASTQALIKRILD